MKKEHPLPNEPILLSDTLSEHPAIQWISQHGRSLLWLLLALVLLGLVYQRFSGGSTATISDYLQAEVDFKQFATQTDAKTQQEAYQRLATVLKKHPDLQSKYDGPLAQILLNRNQTSLANEFANRTLERTRSDQLHSFTDYSTTSLLMANQKYPEALKQAQALQQKLISDPQKAETEDFYGALYLYNLIRIAMLNQQLGNASEELKAWQEFKQAPLERAQQPFPVSSRNYEAVVAQIEEGKASILNYIDAREKVLKK